MLYNHGLIIQTFFLGHRVLVVCVFLFPFRMREWQTLMKRKNVYRKDCLSKPFPSKG